MAGTDQKLLVFALGIVGTGVIVESHNGVYQAHISATGYASGSHCGVDAPICYGGAGLAACPASGQVLANWVNTALLNPASIKLRTESISLFIVSLDCLRALLTTMCRASAARSCTASCSGDGTNGDEYRDGGSKPFLSRWLRKRRIVHWL